MANQNQLAGKKIKMDGKPFTIIEANNGDANCISLQNDTSRLYLRHKDNRLIETGEKDNPGSFASDTSFIPEERGDGFVLRCSNQGMEDNYICKLDIDTYIISEDLVEYVFFAFATSEHESKMTNRPIGESIKQDIESLHGCHFVINETSYLIVAANDKHVEHISLINESNGLYARRFNEKLIESAYEDSKIFLMDSSFDAEFIERGLYLHYAKNGKEKLLFFKEISEWPSLQRI